MQTAVARAVRKAELTKRAACSSFATYLLADGYGIRTVQELLGHKDVKTTMIYTHMLNRGGRGVRSSTGTHVDALHRLSLGQSSWLIFFRIKSKAGEPMIQYIADESRKRPTP
ncbi:MAG: hypothetical protein HBSIN02_06410 [Bacteroidia bacterium]|nr:MAG: hypothetical protein HBSIN02_06410 [Bacteroidia bacterium]